jgi:hypothetical protein
MLKGVDMSIKFVVICDWNYRGAIEEHYEESIITPYIKKVHKDYIPYCCVGGCGVDGVEITGHSTLKQAIMNGYNESRFVGFDKRQKRHLRKVLSALQK